MVKLKHTPIRSCVACRSTNAKRGLMRVVRLPDGSVCYDPNGKMSGRGAYVCARIECVQLARKQKKLERSLKANTVSEAVFTELESRAGELAERGTGIPSALSPAGPTRSAAEPGEVQESSVRNSASSELSA